MANMSGRKHVEKVVEPEEGENLEGPLRYDVSADIPRALVHLDFSQSIDWVALVPDEARKLAKDLNAAAADVDMAGRPKL
jgi:hypothetical protein